MGRWQEKIRTERQPIIGEKQPSFQPVEKIEMVDAMLQIIAGQWQGIGVWNVLQEMQSIWGQQVLVVETGANQSGLRQNYPEMMIFEPNEFLDIVRCWPESEGIVRAKRAFSGQVVEGGEHDVKAW